MTAQDRTVDPHGRWLTDRLREQREAKAEGSPLLQALVGEQPEPEPDEQPEADEHAPGEPEPR